MFAGGYDVGGLAGCCSLLVVGLQVYLWRMERVWKPRAISKASLVGSVGLMLAVARRNQRVFSDRCSHNRKRTM